MVALRSESIGGITGPNLDSNGNPIGNIPTSSASSVRSRDRDDQQYMSLDCDSSKPFSGIVHVEATTTAQWDNASTMPIWTPVGKMEFYHEGGSLLLGIEGEYWALRFVCREGNYWASTQISTSNPVQTVGGTISINTVSVTFLPGDDVNTMVTNINNQLSLGGFYPNLRAEIVSIGTVTNALVIRDVTGTAFTISELVGTPLADIGITTTGNITPGKIRAIEILY